jgi:hypothetical protein
MNKYDAGGKVAIVTGARAIEQSAEARSWFPRAGFFVLRE